ncbi:hypothetical protein CTAYLR_004524 [Chrysophaeum taylorii]|uniref:Prolyl 4-hydroxylase alpha subunit Fe(2+) 2OG dioxygenase domain-containing protein n=1 Tax=Chrysophaeum taylorii TaxID=2483200 RepID=A0AAD7UPD5_9STRA|nr:hypothetical protein CTAYLR_004524 [Chrysophaeum taylorii]
MKVVVVLLPCSVAAFAAKKGGFATTPKKAPKKKKAAPTVVASPPLPAAEGGLVEPQSGLPQFMGAYLIKDPSIPDGIMKLFDETPQVRGMVSAQGGGEPIVDLRVKDSLEMSVAPNDSRREWRRYVQALNECMGHYVNTYPYAGAYGKFGLVSRTNVQRYPPGGGYKTFHTERTGKGEPEGSRHLVFMTYLNTLTDAGGTEFYHQDFVATPTKGLTLVWPAGWEFTHRGVPSPTQEKTITTGWFNYL